MRTFNLPSFFRQNKVLWIGAASGVVLLTAGLSVGRFLVPASSGTPPPEAGLVTVPVAYGKLDNVLTLRGEVGYADPVEVTVDASALEGPAVVTGRIPALDAELAPLSVALEVAGRPMIVLPGALPSYRTLEVGMSCPDVTQFKSAMQAVGIPVGNLESDVFDADAAAAVSEMYSQIGYSVPAAEEGSVEAVKEFEDTVQSATIELAGAKYTLAVASKGPAPVDVQTANNAIASAQRALDTARAINPPVPADIADLEDTVSLAVLARAELNVAPDTGLEQLAVDAARAALATATANLASAEQKAMPVLPAGDLLYLDQLPRRVDAVTATVGAPPEGPALTVSGATLGLSGSVDADDVTLIKVGAKASFELPGGSTHDAVVSEITPAGEEEDRPTVRFTPGLLTPEQIAVADGANVKVDIPVSSTASEVMSVPAAALTAGPGGEVRVEVVDGNPADGTRATTRRVVVETGLATEGAVEVNPVEGKLAEGDLVVVGT